MTDLIKNKEDFCYHIEGLIEDRGI